jgi:uncharacterized protein involved in exopolysaccharide biosynthesis
MEDLTHEKDSLRTAKDKEIGELNHAHSLEVTQKNQERD